MPESTKSSTPDRSLWVVVLAGGAGTRFWPVSTPSHPKQLLPLAGPTPLIRQTIDRVAPFVDPGHIRILTGARLVDPIRSVTDLGPDAFLIEPAARGTAPVLTWAAHEIARRDPDAVMISLHADHAIEPESTFRETLRAIAAMAARHHRLFTIGAVPTRPETGYGYIRPGAALEGSVEAHVVDRFVEKPDRPTAQRYVDEGFLWNTGLFVWPVSVLLDEVRRHTPEIAELLPLLDDGNVEEYFRRSPSLSIDHGVLERSDRVAVARANFSWDDVGTWDSLARTRAGDEHGNVGVGEAHFVDSAGCVAWAGTGDVVLFGTRDLVVVQANGVTFVAPRERAPDLKDALAQLPERLVRLEDDA